MDTILIHSDAGISGNGKPINVAAYAYTIQYKNKYIERVKILLNTTSNIAEMMGVMSSLQKLKVFHVPVIVTSDSQYTIKGINEWYYGWIKRNWKTSLGEPVKNKELWIEFYNLSRMFSDIKFEWTRGHADNLQNNRCDELCGKIIKLYKKKHGENKNE